MARLAKMTKKTVKFTRKKGEQTFSVRHRNRCPHCGRPRAFMRKFQLCRICFRSLALKGDIPGVIKSSW